MGEEEEMLQPPPQKIFSSGALNRQESNEIQTAYNVLISFRIHKAQAHPYNIKHGE